VNWIVLPHNARVVQDASGDWVGTFKVPETALHVVSNHNECESQPRDNDNQKQEQQTGLVIKWR
jgi:hypothetical protein